MLKKSDFFEDRQAVSAALCLWCNSVLNSLKFVQKFKLSVGVDAPQEYFLATLTAPTSTYCTAQKSFCA